MDIILAILMLLIIVMGHEAAHAFTGMLLGYKPRLIAIGIPIEHTIKGKRVSTVFYRRKVGEVEYMFSFLLFGGGVDFYDFDNPPFSKMVAIAGAGPVFNILAAITVAVLFLGWPVTLSVIGDLFDATLLAMGLVLHGQIPLIQTAKMGTMIVELAHTGANYHLGWLLNWMLLNVSLGLVNLFPLPALDGGQIMMSGFVSVLGERFKVPARNITYLVFLLICSFLVVGIGADLLSLL